MNVSQVTQRLAAMYQLIPGITKAFTAIPRTLQPAYLPAVIIYPGESLYDTDSVGDGMVQSIELYRAVLYFDQSLFGTETQTEAGLLPMIDNIKDYFFQRPGLQLDTLPDPEADVVFNAKLIRNGGYQLTSYATGDTTEKNYGSVTFTHQVTNLSEIIYQY